MCAPKNIGPEYHVLLPGLQFSVWRNALFGAGLLVQGKTFLGVAGQLLCFVRFSLL
jgi:hypothetical protein